jgi:hypothetical protein
MPDLPARFAAITVAFASLFRLRTWLHAEILLVGAILAPGKRTVTSILRITQNGPVLWAQINRTT